MVYVVSFRKSDDVANGICVAGRIYIIRLTSNRGNTVTDPHIIEIWKKNGQSLASMSGIETIRWGCYLLNEQSKQFIVLECNRVYAFEVER